MNLTLVLSSIVSPTIHRVSHSFSFSGFLDHLEVIRALDPVALMQSYVSAARKWVAGFSLVKLNSRFLPIPDVMLQKKWPHNLSAKGF